MAVLAVWGSFWGVADAPGVFVQKENPVSVLFVGDIMLDRNVARSAKALRVEALFGTSTRALFAEADLRVGNLEGAITQNPSIAQRNNKILRFTFAPDLAHEVLTTLGFSAVSLANNHTLDFGKTGYHQTRSYLQEWGVGAFGEPYDTPEFLSAALIARGETVCLVGYHGLYDVDTTAVINEIKHLRPACWRLVVLPHWGVEYETTPNSAQRTAAYAFVDAGADLVVGAHPHVVQTYEEYKGKGIFYSLGNFMFDQNFSWETTHSLAVRADFYENKIRFMLTPLTVINQHVEVAVEPDRGTLLERFSGVDTIELP